MLPSPQPTASSVRNSPLIAPRAPDSRLTAIPKAIAINGRTRPVSLMHIFVAETFEQALLHAHNSVRATVGIPPMRWSNELARYAADWARTLGDRGVFEHRPKNRYGENLFMIEGGTTTPVEVVKAWAA